ncbi:hypothetical protein DPMN_111710 [Dreissena polymorpha]|uniref:Uncharacterized protein n=1 Tax=Dreissena polymorpha TaxID=45954 RepID=A0A9D4KFG6_DREPO|nr:hypothetical protein DPMN_111710 [Dreissena polymorpha]
MDEDQKGNFYSNHHGRKTKEEIIMLLVGLNAKIRGDNLRILLLKIEFVDFSFNNLKTI